ncbi:MAG: PD-(D/E)XK nuclease family protein, partial [Sandaracinaceae bacterium]|nr:PD-(D/E)XK nuclease family protein [Sandaracinaceae bacterium]
IEWWFEERVREADVCVDDALRILGADLDASLCGGLIDWRGATRSSLLVEGERLVRLFLEERGDLRARGVEVPFEIPIIDPIRGEQMPRPLIGYFDMKLLSGNVVELKTARAAFSAIAFRTNLQFAAYRTASRYAGVDVEVYALVRTKTPRIQHVVLAHDGSISRWFMHTAARIERAILAGHFPPAPGPLCASCEYRSTCLGEGENVEVEDAEAA